MSVSELYQKGFHVIQIRKCYWSQHLPFSSIPGCQKECKIPNCEAGPSCRSCHPTERPLCKRPVWKNWPDNPASLTEAKSWIHEGGNLAVVGGPQSATPPLRLGIADYDERPSSMGISDFRDLHTLIAFTPRGYHVYFYHQRKMTVGQLIKKTGWPQPQTVRGDAMYVLAPPSRVRGKAYWWLDSGHTEIRTL